jgi:hypothetical protein
VALDACPLAYPAAGGGLLSRARRVAAALAVAGLLLGVGPGRATEDSLAELVAPYLKARDQKSLGTVAASALADPPRPSGDAIPQPSVTITVLPFRAGFQTELDAAKAGLRESVDDYVHTVGRIETARIDYERALLEVGAGDLVRTGLTDAQGAVRLADLPVGDWLVLAWREGGHLTKKFRLRGDETAKFPNVPTSVTYSVVTFWRTRVAVRAGEITEIVLNDRNVWLSAARQEGGTPVPPRVPTKSGNKRR